MSDQQNRSGGRDDSGPQDDPPTPSASGSSGGGIARDIGSRDEEKNATGGEPETTGVTKQDKVQPATNSRSDYKGEPR